MRRECVEEGSAGPLKSRDEAALPGMLSSAIGGEHPARKRVFQLSAFTVKKIGATKKPPPEWATVREILVKGISLRMSGLRTGSPMHYQSWEGTSKAFISSWDSKRRRASFRSGSKAKADSIDPF